VRARWSYCSRQSMRAPEGFGALDLSPGYVRSTRLTNHDIDGFPNTVEIFDDGMQDCYVSDYRQGRQSFLKVRTLNYLKRSSQVAGGNQRSKLACWGEYQELCVDASPLTGTTKLTQCVSQFWLPVFMFSRMNSARLSQV